MICHWMGGSQRARIMVPSKRHAPLTLTQQHSVTSQNIWTLSITVVRSSNLTNKPHGWNNIMNTVHAECPNLCNRSCKVRRSCCLLPAVIKWCNIIRWTLYCQYLEIPHTFFHTLTSRIIWDIFRTQLWDYSGETHHETVPSHWLLLKCPSSHHKYLLKTHLLFPVFNP